MKRKNETPAGPDFFCKTGRKNPAPGQTFADVHIKAKTGAKSAAWICPGWIIFLCYGFIVPRLMPRIRGEISTKGPTFCGPTCADRTHEKTLVFVCSKMP
jgi:hypothetical protein